MSTVVGFCHHCKGMRNMRTTQETRKGAGVDREIIVTHHGETCGLLVENETVRPPTWGELINSLNKFSADFMTEREHPRVRSIMFDYPLNGCSFCHSL